ncbi:hypothetical protein [Bradyrhizobium sp. USDA 241]|uniref:hypothetical protein n=1 Tax=Bradyrhizobium sp. USDA 241 TaxID=3377725 RepID=UPI003C75A756
MEPASSKSLWQKTLALFELDEATLAQRRLQSGSSQIEIVPTEPVSPQVIELRRANRLRKLLILMLFAVTMPYWLPGFLSAIFVIWVLLVSK